MITIQPEHKLTIAFSKDDDRDDITTIANIIKKCAKEAKKSGFRNMFNKNEREVLEGLNASLNGE